MQDVVPFRGPSNHSYLRSSSVKQAAKQSASCDIWAIEWTESSNKLASAAATTARGLRQVLDVLPAQPASAHCGWPATKARLSSRRDSSGRKLSLSTDGAEEPWKRPPTASSSSKNASFVRSACAKSASWSFSETCGAGWRRVAAVIWLWCAVNRKVHSHKGDACSLDPTMSCADGATCRQYHAHVDTSSRQIWAHQLLAVVMELPRLRGHLVVLRLQAAKEVQCLIHLQVCQKTF